MPSTSHKIRVARFLSAIVLFVRRPFGLSPEVVASRGGVTWALNLNEGIDLAIYLLGGFELRTLRRYAQLVKEGDVVLDIGANIGAHTLPLARLAGPSGRVFSFEPTAYAFGKQKANIALNPQLAPRISPHQMMLMAADADPLPKSVYSSWPLESAGDLHHEHHGRLMETEGAAKGTLEGFVEREKIERIDFIKLDVDGNENDVLAGAGGVLERFKPKVMLELAPYVYGSAPHKFDEFLEDFWRRGYRFSDMATGHLLPQNAAGIRKAVPEAGGLNVLASCGG